MEAKDDKRMVYKNKKVKTEFIKYPCPTCGKYFLPYMDSSKGYAFMICPEHGQFKTSISVSANFRKFCSKVARKPNRSPVYYTSTEKKFKKYLEDLGFKEGIDFWHNVRVRYHNGSRYVYYWIDFLMRMLDIGFEIDPKVWHSLWNRDKSDRIKVKRILGDGIRLLSLSDKDLKNKDTITSKLKELKVYEDLEDLCD